MDNIIHLDGTFDNATSMIDAIKAHRAATRAQEEADKERLAEAAVKYDLEVKKWLAAAEREARYGR